MSKPVQNFGAAPHERPVPRISIHAFCEFPDTGAALQVSTTFGLPGAFDLIMDNQRYHCRSMWRTDTKIGVKFESSHPA